MGCEEQLSLIYGPVSGRSFGSASFTNEGSTGWQQGPLCESVPVIADTTYVASYFTPSGLYATDSGNFKSGSVDAPPLPALGNGVDGQNGVYSYGSSRLFPTSSFGAGNYWVDAIYLPTTTYTIAGTRTNRSRW
jgi:hypothetical protein